MKKVIKLIAGIFVLLPVFAFADSIQTSTFKFISPADCPAPGQPGFCTCMENSMIASCEQQLPPKDCTIANIGKLIAHYANPPSLQNGIPISCAKQNEGQSCVTDLDSVYLNNPSNSPRCPL